MAAETRAPCLILFMGCAGSGKTTLALQVLKRRPMTYLNKDTVWEPLLASVESREEYLAQREHWYRLLYTVAEENLAMGAKVLLDAPHVRQVQDSAWNLQLGQLAERTGAVLRCVYCHCSERVLQERLRDRGLERDEWKLANWGDFRRAEPVIVPIPFSHIMVDTGRPVGDCVERVVDYLST